MRRLTPLAHLHAVLPRVQVTCPRTQCGGVYDLSVVDASAVIRTVDCPFCGIRTHVPIREVPFTKECADPGRYF